MFQKVYVPGAFCFRSSMFRLHCDPGSLCSPGGVKGLGLGSELELGLVAIGLGYILREYLWISTDEVCLCVCVKERSTATKLMNETHNTCRAKKYRASEAKNLGEHVPFFFLSSFLGIPRNIELRENRAERHYTAIVMFPKHGTMERAGTSVGGNDVGPRASYVSWAAGTRF